MLCFLINICGVIANGLKETNDIVIWFSLGVVGLCIIYVNLFVVYYKRNWVFFRDIPEYKHYVCFINSFFFIVLSSWSLYPVVFILYKYNIINIEYAAVCFMLLDFISKGVFILNFIKYEDIVHSLDSFTHQIELSRNAAASINQVVPYV
jgi:bacteriorhodopsin